MFSSALDGTNLNNDCFGLIFAQGPSAYYAIIKSVYVIESREDKITLWYFFKSVK